MASLKIQGGRPLHGTIAVEGNKNAALPLLAACLLTPETCELRNVPRIRDVSVMIQLLRSLGAEVEGEGTPTLRVTCRTVTSSQPDPSLVGRLRGSVRASSFENSGTKSRSPSRSVASSPELITALRMSFATPSMNDG